MLYFNTVCTRDVFRGKIIVKVILKNMFADFEFILIDALNFIDP